VIDLEFKVSQVLLFDQEHFLSQSKFAAQPDAADQPHLDFMLQREIEPAGQFHSRQFAPGLPPRVTLARVVGVEV
jgi:hypothetical protein